MDLRIFAPEMLRGDGLTPDYPLDKPLAQRPWWQHPMARFAAFIVCFAVFSIAFGLPAQLAVKDEGPLLIILLAIASIAAATLAYWLVITKIERRPLLELSPRRIGGLLVGLGVGAALVLLVVALIWVFGGIDFLGTGNPSTSDIIRVLFGAGFAAAIVEEILMRGMLLRLLEEFLGTWLAIAVSGFIFGMMHMSNDNATYFSAISIALQAGLLFGALYCLTRSLWLVIGLHFACNVIQGLVFGVAVSGNATTGLLKTEPTGNDLISGGAFGLEGSVITTVLLGLLALGLMVLIHRRGLVISPMWTRADAAKV